MSPLCGFLSTHLDSSSSDQKPPFSSSASAADLHARRSGRPISRKIVVVGDGASGKTSLLHVFVNGSFPQFYEPTVFETMVKDVEVNDQLVELSLWDTAGQEDFEKLRGLSYVDTNVVLLCFSVDQPTSLENIESKWLSEITSSCPGVKLCLVALKCDLREDPATMERLGRFGLRTVGYEEGLETARRIRASRYLECSAKFDRGVREAFDEAARVAVSARRKGETRGSDPRHGDSDEGGVGCLVS